MTRKHLLAERENGGGRKQGVGRKEGERPIELDLKHKAKQATSQKKKRQDQCHLLQRAATSLPVTHHPSPAGPCPCPGSHHPCSPQLLITSWHESGPGNE